MVFGGILYCPDRDLEILCKVIGMFWYLPATLRKQPKFLYRPRLRGLPGKVIGKSDTKKFCHLNDAFSRT
jgi:hypothetical protein